MRVFLDIGAHVGETLEVVLSPDWGFDRIVSFEPAPECWPVLERYIDPRLEVCRFGLWDRNTSAALNNPGDVGASVAADKDDVEQTEMCEFRDASTWFAENISADDEVYAKINIEGAEYEVIESLSASGQLTKINHLLVHFDVRKSPARAHLEPAIRGWLDDAQIEYLAAEEIQFGGVIRGTKNWLLWCQGSPRWRDLRYKSVRRVEHRARLTMYPLKVRLAAARRSNR